MFPRLRFARNNQLGFTLVEMLIVIAIASVITGGITTSIMQILTVSSRNSNHMIAVRQVQQAGKEVSKDGLQAQVVNATGTWGFPLIFIWTEWGTNRTHTVTYELIGSGAVKTLQRSESVTGGNSTTATVAQYIDDTLDPPLTGNARTRCEWNGEVLTFTVTATVGTRSETRVYRVEPRPGS